MKIGVLLLLLVHRLGRAHGSVPFISNLLGVLVTLCSHSLKSLIKYTPNVWSKVCSGAHLPSQDW